MSAPSVRERYAATIEKHRVWRRSHPMLWLLLMVVPGGALLVAGVVVDLALAEPSVRRWEHLHPFVVVDEWPDHLRVNPSIVVELAEADQAIDLIDVNDLSATSLWPVTLIFASAVALLVSLRCWLKEGSRDVAAEIYRSNKEEHKAARIERKRREEAVASWGDGYSRMALVLLVLIEVPVFLVLSGASLDVLPWTRRDSGGWAFAVGALYVLRLVAWCSIWGFVAWVHVRPRLIDRVIDPLESSEIAPDLRPLEGTALALSGGGIRSAAFSLGALDALQYDASGWRDVRYVCAVSGGAYTAGLLASLRAQASDLDRGKADESLRIDGAALRYVCNRSNYLAPGVTGKWRAFNDWGSGLLVTLALYASSVVIVGGALGVAAALLQQDSRDIGFGAAGWAVLGAAFLGVFLTVGSHLAVEKEKEPWRRCGEAFGWIWAVLVFLVFVVPATLDVVTGLLSQIPDVVGWTGGLAAAATLIGAAIRSVVKQASAPVATYLAGIIVPALTAIGLAFAAYWGAEFAWFDDRWPPSGWATVIFGCALFVLGAAFLVDAKKLSLHPFYRSRLATAFSLKMIHEQGDKAGVADVEGRMLSEIESIRDAESGTGQGTIICAAANVVGSPVAPPGRGALSFTFSNPDVGIPGSHAYQPAWREPGELTEDSDTFTLMSAVAISGAAVSPGMGKMTRRSYESLLAVANVRLGVWLPNPLAASRDELRSPKMVPYFFKELLGLHTLLDPYLYVTDGGHWDNLGLVEALRLRPKRIIVLDSSGDRPGTFSTLGEAKSLAEMELCVRIEIDTSELAPQSQRGKRVGRSGARPVQESRPLRSWVRGTAVYPDGSLCELIYCRALVTKDAPLDVASFAAKHAAFPNHSTLRQLFHDETFEAYRALGYHCAKSFVLPAEAGWQGSLNEWGITRVGASR